MDTTAYEPHKGLNDTRLTEARPIPLPEGHFTIGDLAREYSITLRALRFYEDKGLLAPQRSGLTRLYSNADRERLALILKGKQLGFTLTEIRALLARHESAAQNGAAPAGTATGAAEGLALTRERCARQLAQLERQRAEIDTAIGELKGMLEQLPAA